MQEPENGKVIITVSGGVVQNVTKTGTNAAVFVHDYDVDESAEKVYNRSGEESKFVGKDENGDYYTIAEF